MSHGRLKAPIFGLQKVLAVSAVLFGLSYPALVTRFRKRGGDGGRLRPVAALYYNVSKALLAALPPSETFHLTNSLNYWNNMQCLT